MIKIKDIVGSPSLHYHIENGLTLSENVYRYSSESFIQLFSEAKSAWRDGYIDLNEQDVDLLENTDIGLYGEYKGQKVPLDLPMLDEQGGDTSWDDGEGNKVTLQDILDMTKNIPQKEYPTEKLAKIVLNWDDNPEEIDRISQVEISKQYPILIMVDEGGKIQWILDGNHRAQKALRAKSETIPAKLIKPSNLDAKAKKVLLNVPMESVNEAQYQGKEVPLNKPKRGGSKKFYVYVKNNKGNVQKVSFGGTTGLNVKIDEPGARASFAARHQCDTKKDKTKPGYWACNIGRYWKSLGGSKNFSGYW
tara:strand:- start:437 stop:1354 length:918 start_codon:yes stop_codon:yes gene_type:complete